MNESKNVRKNVSMMLTGMVIGAALTGGAAAVAAGIMAERSHHRVVVDGKEVYLFYEDNNMWFMEKSA